MINWMTNNNEEELINSAFGNYTNTTPIINLGRTSYGCDEGSYWYQDPFVETWIADTSKAQGVENKTGYLWTTGASNEARKKNLYDVAGNVWEWTEETAFYGGNSSVQYRIMRGGGFIGDWPGSPVCYRYGHATVNDTNFYAGFRVVLYMR